MSDLLLITSVLEPSAEVLPALGSCSHPVRVLPGRRVGAGRGAARRRGAGRRPPRSGAREPLPAAADDGPGLPAVRGRDRGRPGRGDRRVGRRRRDPADPAGPAEVDARLRLAHRPRAGADAGREAPARSRSGELAIDEATYTARLRGRAARPHLQGVRAAQVPRPAPGPGLHPGPAAAGGLGLRLLRRHPHGRRPRPPAARQARHRARAADRHRAQRRLQVRTGPPAARSGWRPPSGTSTTTPPTRRRTAPPPAWRAWPEEAARGAVDVARGPRRRRDRAGHGAGGRGDGRRRHGAAFRARPAAPALDGGDTDAARPDSPRTGDELVGYAHLDLTDPVRRRGRGELAVAPRPSAVGPRYRASSRRCSSAPPRRADTAAALGARRAPRRGRARQPPRLHPAPACCGRCAAACSRRSPSPHLPDGVHAAPVRRRRRTSRSGSASTTPGLRRHPEQGGWNLEQDLELREAEPWFDPAGFLLAVDANDRLLGFHWTKVHGGADPGAHVTRAHRRGLRASGVDPSARACTSAAALTLAGLRHLRDRGIARGDALRRRGQRRRRPHLRGARLHPRHGRRHVPATAAPSHRLAP